MKQRKGQKGETKREREGNGEREREREYKRNYITIPKSFSVFGQRRKGGEREREVPQYTFLTCAVLGWRRSKDGAAELLLWLGGGERSE